MTDGCLEGFGKGVFLTNVKACRLTHLRLHGGTTGLAFQGNCQANFVLDCSVTSVSGEGIEL